MQPLVCTVKSPQMSYPLAKTRIADDSLRMSKKTPVKSGVQTRLRYAMGIRDMGVRELERALGGGNASISKTLNRPGAGLSADRGREVARILHVRYEWLMWGEEPMVPQPHSSTPPSRTASGVRNR